MPRFARFVGPSGRIGIRRRPEWRLPCPWRRGGAGRRYRRRRSPRHLTAAAWPGPCLRSQQSATQPSHDARLSPHGASLANGEPAGPNPPSRGAGEIVRDAAGAAVVRNSLAQHGHPLPGLRSLHRFAEDVRPEAAGPALTRPARNSRSIGRIAPALHERRASRCPGHWNGQHKPFVLSGALFDPTRGQAPGHRVEARMLCFIVRHLQKS
jgi:hypothetical protein